MTNYPQPIHGFILRASGELPRWDTQAKLAKLLEPFPKEYVGVSMSDPRPTLKFLLALAPPLITLANSATAAFLPASPQFDVNLIPNGHEATRHLFPNITVTSDDGRRIRIETRASLNLPF